MIPEVGDMWTVFGKTDLWCFTGSNTLKSHRLAMCVGLAKEVKEKIPTIPRMVGIKLERWRDKSSLPYGLLVVEAQGQAIGVVQSKGMWNSERKGRPVSGSRRQGIC